MFAFVAGRRLVHEKNSSIIEVILLAGRFDDASSGHS